MIKLLLFLLLPFVSFGQVQIGDAINGEAAGDRSGISVNLSSSGTIIAIGARENNDNGINSGHARVYENQGGNWIQIGQDIDGENANDLSGTSIDLSSDGNIIAIGAIGNEDNGVNSGHVRVYGNQEGNWIQIGQDIDGENPGDFFGISVSLSSNGTILAIGSQGASTINGSQTGLVKIYENQDGNWIQLGENLNGTNANDFFGRSIDLSLNGDIIAIGAFGNDDNGVDSGQVKIFENQDGNWVQLGTNIDGQNTGDNSGISLSLVSDGTIVAIGSSSNNTNGENAGQVSIYENQGGNWTQIGENLNGENASDRFGISVSISQDGTIVAVGAFNNDSNGDDSGKVYIYKIEDNNWVQIGNSIIGENAGDLSGLGLSLSNSTLAIGAQLNDDNEEDSGHVRIYDLSDVLSTQLPTLITLSLYPNPTKNNFTITLADHDILQKATIYNSLGQEVLNSTQTTIDVSSLSKGLYVVEVQTTTGKGTQKLIVE